MVKLSACVEMLFNEGDAFSARIARAAACGFDAYEFWGWGGKDLEDMGEGARKAGLPCAAACVDTRDEARKRAYDDGCLLKAQNAQVYAEMVAESIEALAPLGVKTLISTTGQALEGVSRQAQQEAVVTCLRAAAPVAERAGITIVLEPLNILVDHAGYYLPTSAQAFEILRQVGSPAVTLLYDIYHQQITEGNLTDTINANIGAIGHFHLADVPGRFEPGTGEINYAYMMRVLDQLPYDKYVGCEYRPSRGVSAEESARAILGYAHGM